MPRTIWEWLEIEETTDRSLIRRAYARQAAKYHPEEAPEEAMQLREAYKRALALADRKAAVSDLDGITPEEADAEISKNSPGGLHESCRFGIGGQGKTGQEPGAEPYRHAHQEEEGKREPEPGSRQSPGYRHAHQEEEGKQEPESGSRQSPGYRYAHQEEEGKQGPEPGAKQSPGYRYACQEEEKVPEPGARQSPNYRYGRYGERQEPEQESGPVPETGYRYQPRQLDADRAERTRRLARRLIDLYESPAYRYSGKLWTEAIKEYLNREDLQDPLVIATLLPLLQRMSGLDDRVLHVMERELFRYARKEPEWIQLKEYFAHIRRQSGIRSRAEQRNVSSGSQDGRTERQDGAGAAATDKTKRILLRMILFAAAVLAIRLGNGFRKEQEREQRFQEMVNSMREEPFVTRQYDIGSLTQDNVYGIMDGSGENTLTLGQESVEAFQECYKSSPYYIDLDGDEIDDRIRFDHESNGFIVEYYDPITDEYVFQGTVDQYMEENTEDANLGQLMYFRSVSSLDSVDSLE